MARRGGRRLAAVRAETASGTVQIVADPGREAGRVLLVEGTVAAYVDLADPTHLALDYVRRMADAIDVLVPRGAPLAAVHLGGGGFALPRHLAATRPAARQEAYELDAEIVALARTHLRLRRTAALRVRVGDARALLARRPAASCDLVVRDAFAGTTVPPHLATLEFAREVAGRLRPGGVYLVNAVDAPPFDGLRAEAATLLAAFGSVAAFGAREVVRRKHAGNLLLAASAAALPVAALRRALAAGPHPCEVLAGDAVRALAGGARPLRDA